MAIATTKRERAEQFLLNNLTWYARYATYRRCTFKDVDRCMRSDITDIRSIVKYGAHGDPTKCGTWVYGIRPDGKTVACQQVTTEEGGILIYSRMATNKAAPSTRQISPQYRSKRTVEQVRAMLANTSPNELAATEFTAAEWRRIRIESGDWQQITCNEILRSRTTKPTE